VRDAKRTASLRRFLRRNPLVLIGGTVLVVWIVVSAAAPLIAPYGPLTQKIVERLQPPSGAHPFGTDPLGRDILSRVLYGGRISLPVGFLLVTVSLVIGGLIGALAGFGAGWLDSLLMRSPTWSWPSRSSSWP
jgi:peptide/nickel transport system permease protein